MRCARAVRKVGYFGPMFPDGPGDRSNDCVPIHRTAQILTQSQNSDNEVKQTMFRTENARLPSKKMCCVCPVDVAFLVVVVLRVVTEKLNCYWALQGHRLVTTTPYP